MIRLSKEISYILRHTTLPRQDPHGWVDIPDLQKKLKHPSSYEDIKRVVDTNDKVQESSILQILIGLISAEICTG